MTTLLLAVRNLLRNRRRSLATLLALAIGAASVLLFGGYSADIHYTLLTNYVRSGGHLQVQHRDFFLFGNGNPTAYGIADYGRIIQAIRDDEVLRPMIKVVTPTLQFGGIAGNYDAGVSRTVMGEGFVPEDMNLMRQWDEFGTGQEAIAYALMGAPADSAILGVGVARVLLLCQALAVPNCTNPEVDAKPVAGKALPADIAALTGIEQAAVNRSGRRAGSARIELLASHGRGSPNVAALNVVAAEDQGFKDLDDVAVILQLSQAQKLVYGRAAPRATSVMVQLAKTSQMRVAAERMRSVLAQAAPGMPLVVRDFEALNPFYSQTQQLFDTIFTFIFVLIGGIVLFTVGNTMNAAVVERTIEIGTLRAIGLRQLGIRQMFVTEGLMLGCLGAIVGLAAALLIAYGINAAHLTWLPPGSSQPLPLTIRVWGETRMLLGTTVGLIFIAAVSAWWPAWRAAKLKIVDALRHA